MNFSLVRPIANPELDQRIRRDTPHARSDREGGGIRRRNPCVGQRDINRLLARFHQRTFACGEGGDDAVVVVAQRKIGNAPARQKPLPHHLIKITAYFMPTGQFVEALVQADLINSPNT